MIKLEYRTENKINKIEVKKDQVENMIKAGWVIAKKTKKKVEKIDS